jgi:hypothetical protein
MTGVFYLWLLLLNVMIAILRCTAIQLSNNATNPCLAHLTLATACCAAVVAAAQQWWRPPMGIACHNFQHDEQGCSPVSYKKCQIGGNLKGLAGLGGMGKQDVPIESGWCRSTGTGRVPVMEQSQHESASEALAIQAQGRPAQPPPPPTPSLHTLTPLILHTTHTCTPPSPLHSQPWPPHARPSSARPWYHPYLI